MISIGVIDTMGMVSSIEALDTCLKTAEVRLVSSEKITGGLVSFTITGDVAAVVSAVDAGVAAAQRLGGYHHHTVIARIDQETHRLLRSTEIKDDRESRDTSGDSTEASVEEKPKAGTKKPKKNSGNQS